MALPTIQPIETHYKGYRFRSRLEARWAVFFDHIGASWLYEAEGYQLQNGEWYLPDFEISNIAHERRFEIKPVFPSPSERQRAALAGAAIIVGQPYLELDGRGFYIDTLHYHVMTYESNDDIWESMVFARCRYCPALGLMSLHFYEGKLANPDIGPLQQGMWSSPCCGCNDTERDDFVLCDKFTEAYGAARAARF